MTTEEEGTPLEPAESLEQAFDAEQERIAAEEAEPVEPEWFAEIPQHWPQDYREVLRSGDPDKIGQWAITRHRDMEADYTRKTQSLAEERRQYERQLEFATQVQQLVSPLAQRFAAQGWDEGATVRAALAAFSQYVENPRGVAEQLARQVGLNIADQEQEFVDPNIARLQQQQERVMAYLQQQDAARQQAFQALQHQQAEKVRTEVVSEIDQFRQQKDEHGRLLYPHYEKLKPKMAALMQAQGPDGSYLVNDLADAYQKAMALSPELQKPADDKVKRARRAASGVSGGASDMGGGGYESWRDAFAAYEAHVS